MDFLPALHQHILDYLAGAEDLNALREWLAPLVIEAGEWEDPILQRKAYQMQRTIADFAEGFLLEPQVKQNFSALLFPSQSLTSFHHPYSDLQASSVRSGSGTLIEGKTSAGFGFVGVGPAVGCV